MGKIDWKELVRGVAPTVATALGGPFAGIAVKMIGNKVLGKPDATEDDVAGAIANGSPDALIRLREVETEFLKFMENAGIERERLAVNDRDSARKRQMALGDKTPQILTVFCLIAWVAMQYVLLTHVVPAENRELIARALGTLDALLGMGFTYFLGSSSGSKDKTALLEKAIR